MELSVIIVNYNVKHFLEQCLISVKKALVGIEGEIIVVDNNSVDGSLNLLNNKFSEIKVIANKNTGFSVANNQGIKIAKGSNILLLNPDTVIQEDSLRNVWSFLTKIRTLVLWELKCMMEMEDFFQNLKEDYQHLVLHFIRFLGCLLCSQTLRPLENTILDIFHKRKSQSRCSLWCLYDDKKKVLDEVGLLDETFSCMERT